MNHSSHLCTIISHTHFCCGHLNRSVVFSSLLLDTLGLFTLFAAPPTPPHLHPPPSHGVAVPVALVFTSPVVWCVGTKQLNLCACACRTFAGVQSYKVNAWGIINCNFITCGYMCGQIRIVWFHTYLSMYLLLTSNGCAQQKCVYTQETLVVEIRLEKTLFIHTKLTNYSSIFKLVH